MHIADIVDAMWPTFYGIAISISHLVKDLR